MTKSEFKKERLQQGQPVSFLDLSGNTYYGIYEGMQEPDFAAFSFQPRGSSGSRIVYLKEVVKFYKSL